MSKQIAAPSYEEMGIVIHAFYAKLMKDEQLAHFFDHIEDFSKHEKRITDFWWMNMGGKLEQPPKIDMMGKHFPLDIKQEDLELWLALFSSTLKQHLSEDKAIYWMDKALRIAARLKQIIIDRQPMGLQINES